jgi:hypothetical protein
MRRSTVLSLSLQLVFPANTLAYNKEASNVYTKRFIVKAPGSILAKLTNESNKLECLLLPTFSSRV